MTTLENFFNFVFVSTILSSFFLIMDYICTKNMNIMDANRLVKKSDDFIANEVDGEIVMMNIETGTYISLNHTGKSIWNILETPATIGSIVLQLVDLYGISKEQCEADVFPFLEQLLEQKIIE